MWKASWFKMSTNSLAIDLKISSNYELKWRLNVEDRVAQLKYHGGPEKLGNIWWPKLISFHLFKSCSCQANKLNAHILVLAGNLKTFEGCLFCIPIMYWQGIILFFKISTNSLAIDLTSNTFWRMWWECLFFSKCWFLSFQTKQLVHVWNHD